MPAPKHSLAPKQETGAEQGLVQAVILADFLLEDKAYLTCNERANAVEEL